MPDSTTRISIFGLGYVGSVSAACFARMGHSVIGVDAQAAKVDLINAQRAPIIEKDLETLVQEAGQAGRLRATQSAADAVANSDVSIICVGTPSRPNGSLDVAAVGKVCEEIGQALRDKSGHHVVVVRSTILPGTMRDLVRPTLEAHSGKRAGVDFGVANNPEFLREGTAVYDFTNPPKTVIGASDEETGARVAALYHGIDAPVFITPHEVAEMIKYADNAWHAVKVGFGNEIGNICKALDIDSHHVMEIFCQDTKLNLSPYYLKPGFAFGGSCLPKDVRAITYTGRTLDLNLPLLNSLMPSNQEQVARAVRMVMAAGSREIGVLGFSFKAGTDDLRESPMVELIERLIGKGYDLRLYDKNVSLARLVGSNKAYILETIPHISNLMVDSIDDVLAHGKVIVIGNNDPDFHQAASRLNADQSLIDMVRVPDGGDLGDRYDGINW